VLGAVVFMEGASSWATGCSVGSPGLLVSAVAGRGSMDACGWVVVLRT
jgi:hypothetical protein